MQPCSSPLTKPISSPAWRCRSTAVHWCGSADHSQLVGPGTRVRYAGPKNGAALRTLIRTFLFFVMGAVMTTIPAQAQSLAADPALIDDLVAANRILYDQGVVDGFGHVSVRHDKRPEHFLLARSMAPGLVEAGDIMEFDPDGVAVDPKGRTPYLERFIHSEIFKTRPEIQAVVHSHSPSVIPFGVVAVGLQPIYHMSSFLGAGVPV